ncbi:putative PWWP domain-containing protein [Helianthus anomalus]
MGGTTGETNGGLAENKAEKETVNVQTSKGVNIGELLWVKLNETSWWPAQVCKNGTQFDFKGRLCKRISIILPSIICASIAYAVFYLLATRRPQELSARRLKVMQSLGLVAPLGSPFPRNQVVPANPTVLN